MKYLILVLMLCFVSTNAFGELSGKEVSQNTEDSSSSGLEADESLNGSDMDLELQSEPEPPVELEVEEPEAGTYEEPEE